jgi:hypothetical protein
MFFENLCYRENYAMRASNNRHQKIAQQEQALILANKYIDASCARLLLRYKQSTMAANALRSWGRL